MQSPLASCWKRVFLLAAVFCVLNLVAPRGSGQSDPAQATDKESKATVARLVEQLEADQLVDRDEAEKKLLELGTEALRHLPAVSASTSAELKVRLQRIRSQLEKIDVQSRIDAVKFDLQGKMTIGDALKKLKELSGNDLRWEGDLPQEIELNLQGVYFWQALDSVLDLGKLDIAMYSDEETEEEGLKIQSRTLGSSRGERAAYSGLFRFEATQVATSKSLTADGMGQLTVTLAMQWEPRLEPVYMNVPGKALKAVATKADGSKQELVSTNPNSNPEYTPVDGAYSAEIAVQVQLPERSAKVLDELQGELVAVLPGKLQTFRFDNLASPPRGGQKLGDVTISLQTPRRNGSVTEVRMLLSIDESVGVLDSYRGWVLNNEAFILDPKGEKLPNVGYQTFRMTDTEVGIAYLYELPKDLKGYTFVYEVPGSVSREVVPFVIKNVPLP